VTVAHVLEALAVVVVLGSGATALVLKRTLRRISEGPGVHAWAVGKQWRVLVTDLPVETPPVDPPNSLAKFTKRCRGCWLVKGFAAFPADRTEPDGLKPMCETCWSTRGTFAAVRRVWQRG
jgi:hypothetical protein